MKLNRLSNSPQNVNSANVAKKTRNNVKNNPTYIKDLSNFRPICFNGKNNKYRIPGMLKITDVPISKTKPLKYKLTISTKPNKAFFQLQTSKIVRTASDNTT